MASQPTSEKLNRATEQRVNNFFIKSSPKKDLKKDADGQRKTASPLQQRKTDCQMRYFRQASILGENL
ncbi:MAG TPA: hypothetical protein DDW52_14475 [Planctomycetaceae bacterium]|nr:hypothetical protein [Planctomycetaceae bacterium]